MSGNCPNCGAPRVCEPGQEVWEFGCFYGFGDHACDYAARLVAEHDIALDLILDLGQSLQKVEAERDALQKQVDEFTIYSDKLYDALEGDND